MPFCSFSSQTTATAKTSSSSTFLRRLLLHLSVPLAFEEE